MLTYIYYTACGFGNQRRNGNFTEIGRSSLQDCRSFVMNSFSRVRPCRNLRYGIQDAVRNGLCEFAEAAVKDGVVAVIVNESGFHQYGGHLRPV